MKKFFFVLFLILLSSNSFSLILKLYPFKGVDLQNVYLKDIGELVREREDYFIRRDIIISPIPKLRTVLTAEKLSIILKKKLHQEVKIIGKKIILYPLYTNILLPEITEKIKRAIQNKYPRLDEVQLDLIYLKVPVLKKIPSGIAHINVSVPGGKINHVKYVRVEILDYNNQVVKSVSFPVKIKLFGKVLFAKHDLYKGKLLKKSDFISKQISILEDDYLLKKDIQIYVGKTINTFLSKNKPFLTEYIQ